MAKSNKPYIPPSRDAAIVRGYLKGKLGTPGYVKTRKGNFASEGTPDVRANAKRIGVDVSKPRSALKRVSDAGVQFENLESQKAQRKSDPAGTARVAARTRAAHRGRK